jgi:hypothetical protein
MGYSFKGIGRQSEGVLFTMQTGLLRLEVCSDSILRVLYTPTPSFPDVKHLAVIKSHRQKSTVGKALTVAPCCVRDSMWVRGARARAPGY